MAEVIRDPDCHEVGALKPARLLLLGCGALGRELVLALATIAHGSYAGRFTVIVGSRDIARADWLVTLGRARAHAAGSSTEFVSRSLDWSSPDNLAQIIVGAAPTAIVQTASLQSAWSLSTPNAWSQLVNSGGYAVTAALQASLLHILGRALAVAKYAVPVVNACYPDVINAGARCLGLEVLCGLGNIALLAEALRQHVEPPQGAVLRVLAGHWDVTQWVRLPSERAGAPQVWLNDARVAEERFLGAAALAGDATMNALSAGTSARLLVAVASGSDLDTIHVPGPLGELGGYPVKLRRGALVLDLPPSLARERAVAWNTERCAWDGATVESGRRLVFAARAAERLDEVAPDLAGGFDFADIAAVAREFCRLRELLTARPPVTDRGAQ